MAWPGLVRWLGLRALAAMLGVAAPSAHADNLLVAWQLAQQRDAAFVAARQALQLSRQAAVAGADEPSAMRQRVAALQYRLAEQDLVLRLCTAYIELLAVRRRADLALAQMHLQARQLRQAQRSGEAAPAAGGGQEMDAQQRFDQARAQRVSAVRELEQRRAEFESLAGPLPGQLQELRRDFAAAAPEPADAAHWIELAGREHPGVGLQQLAVNAAGTAPAARQQAQAALERVRVLVAGQAGRAFDNAMQGLARVQALAVSLRAARPAAEAALASQAAGLMLARDAALTLQRYQLAEQEWFERRAGALVDHLRLKAAAGQLDERDLAALNALLVPVGAVP